MPEKLPDILVQKRLFLVGGGKMGGALLKGWLEAGLKPENVLLQEPTPSADMRMVGQLNPSVDDLRTASPEIIVLAIKPQVADTVLAPLGPLLPPGAMVISLLAGLSIARLAELLGHYVHIVRAMPNTPVAIGKGMTALVSADAVISEQRDDAGLLMRAVGQAVWLEDEKLMDAVTAISGSGPAYLFYFTEAIMAAGQNLGLSRELAHQLALQTIMGAAAMLTEMDADVVALRRNVTSPGGTTEAALDVLASDTGGLVELMRQATVAAAARARQLALPENDRVGR